MAGYSGTPLSKKLGLKSGTQFLVLNAPQGYLQLLEPLPPFIKITQTLPKKDSALDTFDTIHAFHTSLEVLATDFPTYMSLLKQNGAIWISWYKKSAKKKTDIDENLLRQLVLRLGVVDVKVAAVDEEWSALKMVRRVADRRVSVY